MENTQLLFSRSALLVEDQEVNARIATHLMNQRGVNVACAVNAEQAVEMFKASQPFFYDVIFTDIVMPGGSGMDEAREIRALDRPDAKTIPILALTASASAEDVENYRAAGMDDILPKPIQPAQLDDLLEKWTPVAKEERAKEQPSGSGLSKLPQLHTLDIQQALRYADGDTALCMEILKEYGVSLPQRIDAIRQAVVGRDFATYAIEFHKLRSAVATVGAPDLAEDAARLEQAGRTKNTITILKGTQRFLTRLNEQYTELCAVLRLDEEDQAAGTPDYAMTAAHLRKELEALLELLQEEKYVEADTLLAELGGWEHAPEDADFLRQLRKDLRKLNYNTAMDAIRMDRIRYEAGEQ